MPRPRGFDEDTVLDAATDLFWRRGYAATSVRDLGAAMRLSAPSLYNAFGDKQGLFARCLDRYLDGTMRARIRRLESGKPPRRAIEAFLGEIVAASLEDPRGCLLVNVAQELGPHDAAIASLVAARTAELEGFFLRALRAGQAEGRIDAGLPAEDMARLLTTTVFGLRVLARSRPDRALLHGAARQAIAMLIPPAKEPAP